MNEDDEDYDELPPITVNSSSRDSSSFSMPSASEVATERARADRCERELALLRAEHAGAAGGGALHHSDSSGSEGEAALAAAVTALQVRAAAARRPAPRLADLLAAAAAPPPAAAHLAPIARAAAAAGESCAAARAAAAFRAVVATVRAHADSGARPAGEALAAGVWLCLALAAREGRALGPALPRAAHLLLDEALPAAEAGALAAALLRALPEPRARLELADAVRSGGAGAGALADALTGAALGALLPAAPAEAARRWRRLGAHERDAALQLAARARAHGGAAEAALLAALAGAPPAPRDHCPDALKVLVAASKLRVLFRIEK